MERTRPQYGTALAVLMVAALLAGPAACAAPWDRGQPATPSMLEGTAPGAVPLPAPCTDGDMSVERALAGRRSVRDYGDSPLTLAELGQLLWAAQGITDERTGFRTAPSAGALYPLEVYVVAGRVEGLAAGVYQYAPRGHSLLRLAEGDVRPALFQAALQQSAVLSAPAVLVFGAVYSRTAARYGDRAARYVHIEVGHAGQNVYLQAQARGLGTVAIGAFDEAGVKAALGLPAEVEPLYLMPAARR